MASTFSTASSYNPLSGLTSGMNGAQGYFTANPFQPKLPTAAPNTGASGSPAQSIATPGFTPDWGSLISNDAGLLGIQAQLGAGQAADAGSRDAAIQQALVQFGEVPDVSALAKSLGMSEDDLKGVLGPEIQQLAQDSTGAGVSTVSRLNQAHQDALMQMKNELNKRGLLNSGEAGYQLDREGTGYRQAQFDSRAKLLGYLADYQKGFLQGQAQRSGTLGQAYSDAANRQYASNQGTPGGVATLDHVDANGQAVYRGPDGSLYNPDGSAYVLKSPTAPPAPPAPQTDGIPDVRRTGGLGLGVPGQLTNA